MPDIVLAADLGGTNLRMAAVDHQGEILHLARRPTPNEISPFQLLELSSALGSECQMAAGEAFTTKAVGFASPAPAAKGGNGTLTKLPNLPSLNGMDLADGLRRRFSVPVALEDDATAAAIGEHWLGASRNVRNSIMVTLGTGVGGGLIIDGEPYRGIDGTAGEIGHITVESNGHRCGCGSHGCLEQYASASAILRLARDAGLPYATSREVYQGVERGDKAAVDVFNVMGRYLGMALAGLMNILNPEMVVIGGGVSAGWDAFIEPLRNEIDKRAFEAPAKRAVVVPSALGDFAGILGVARSAFSLEVEN